MPPFNHFTTKAKEAVRRAHELAVERGQNQVSPLHLLAALLLQEESLVASALEKLEIDLTLLTDTVLENLESVSSGSVLSPSYQLYLTPELVQALERSAKVATELHDEFVSAEREVSPFTESGPRRTKNNPILIGEAGVGTTAIAEGLAQPIATGDCP